MSEFHGNTDLMGLGYWLPGWRSSRGGGCSPGHLKTQQVEEEHVTHDLGGEMLAWVQSLMRALAPKNPTQKVEC